jgi:hypothetical protein
MMTNLPPNDEITRFDGKYFVMSTFGFEIHMFLAGKDDLPRLVEVDGGRLQASLAGRSLLAENRDHILKW